MPSPNLLTYDDAILRILHAVPHPNDVDRVEFVPLTETRGRALAQDVVARENVPPFDNSAVDGFAVRLEDTQTAAQNAPVSLRITQTVAAGDTSLAHVVQMGEAARIFTGAPLPPGADAVIMVEDTNTIGTREDETVRLFAPASPSFIRRSGSDISEGQTAIFAGTVMGAGTIGLLAALGNVSVPCFMRPRVGLITTGDEVVQRKNDTVPLLPGQIHDANGPALHAAIEEAGAVVAVHRHARDTPDDVEAAFDACLAAGCDVIIASGGVSVGDRDFVKAVVEKRGRLDFWRVTVRPGKPLAFGTVGDPRSTGTDGDALFWGLPGNPVSSLVTFELFVRPALRKMGGFPDVSRRPVPVRLSQSIEHEPGRREFVRAHVEWQAEKGTFYATPTGAQGSHRLMSLVSANALAVLREERGNYEAGEEVIALLLDY